MPLYFAYGANMDLDAMRVRCPSSRPLGAARLAQHRVAIMHEGYATVVRATGRQVHGLLWDLVHADMPALDRYEGVGGGLYTKLHLPIATRAGLRRALVYLGRNAGPGLPRPGYLEGVLAAARALALPDSHLRDLAALGPAGRSALDAVPSRARPAVTPTRRTPHDPQRPDTPRGWRWTP